MKKLYFLALLCCSFVYARAQVSVATIYASGTTGSYTTGNATSGARTDGSIITTAATQRGYAVFDLSAIPAGALIGSVTIGFYTSTYGGSGAPSGWDTYGYPGDLSTVTLAGTLFADMVAGTSLSTATYGTGVGAQTLTTTAAMVSFVQANIGGKVSVCWTGGSSRIYTITGETGATTTTGVHAPYIQINYCTAPSSVTASLNPAAVCVGDTVFLSGAATGANTYIWTGPSGFISTSTTALDTFFTSTAASVGTYTLSAVNNCSTFATSVNVTAASSLVVNPLPSPISAVTTICTGNATTITDPTSPGTWTSSDPTIISVGPSSGLITGNSSGLAIITYTTTTGGTSCYVTAPIVDNNPPSAIAGASNVCDLGYITLFDVYGGGTWNVTAGTGTALIGSSSGVLEGTGAGTVNVTYTITGCLPVYYPISVDPLPSNITPGTPESVCVGSTITLGDPTLSGTWESQSLMTALVSSSGVVTGVAAGVVNIDYVLASGCMQTKSITVNPLPAAIGGIADVCVGNGLTLTDGSSPGTFTSTGVYAPITGTGALSAIAPGVETITYTLSTTCATTGYVTVDPVPSAIAGSTTICQNTTTILSDTDPGGTWSSTASAIASIGSAGLLSGATAGSAIISYTFATGCAAATLVSINPAPAAIITAGGPTTFCAGGSVTLNANAGAGLTYQWDDGLGAISGATDITYTASTTDGFTVAVTNADNCTTVSPPTAVTAGIDAIIVYSTSPSFCIGSNVLLDMNTGGAVGTITYQWQKNGVDISGAVSNTYDATTSGIYSCNVVIVGSSGSCTVSSTTVSVSEHSLPTPSVNYSGGVLSTASGYSSYQWYLNTSSIPGANSSRYVPTTTGNYRVEVTDVNGCSGYSSGFPVNELAVPVVTGDQVEVYPNPASSSVNIQSPVAVRSVITDVSGKTLIETRGLSVDISSLAPGMYIMALYDVNDIRVKVVKLVKE